MMSFIEQMKMEANYTSTLNGAKTHASTGDACLDFFAVAGGMRYRKKAEQIRLFDRAYIETPDLAMKLLFHIRDIREGMGERTLFRTLLQHVACTWPDSVRKNVGYISEYGRWDDLICLLNTPARKEAVRVIRKQLEKDLAAAERRENGETDAIVSLLAKWLPSANASSPKTRMNAHRLAFALQMSEKDYRHMLSRLRAQSGLVERRLTAKKADKIVYEHVPAQAMLKYRSAFARQDKARYEDYLAGVIIGDRKMHADTLFPYELLRPYFNSGCSSVSHANGEDTLEALWQSMHTQPGNTNALSVIDTSGSMYCSRSSLKPALISQAMGLYCAERCTGTFHNVFITFESTPHVMEIHGKTLHDKLRYLSTTPWGGSTNLEAVFDLILQTAVRNHTPQKEMPAVLYIFSDMEFNQAISNPSETIYENARRKFEASGYSLPAVVFHNVNSWQMQTPVTAHTRGSALTSGASVSALTKKFDGNVTPMSHMLRVLNSHRYQNITA